MTEKTIQEAIQIVLIATATFDTGDVTINDWGVLDKSTENAPYTIIETADEFESLFRVDSDENTYQVILNLVERFVDWDTSKTAFRDTREIVRAALADPNNAVSGLAVRSVRSGGPISPIYETYGQSEIQADALPTFLTQRLIAECQEF
jgi:hypothetical protein